MRCTCRSSPLPAPSSNAAQIDLELKLTWVVVFRTIAISLLLVVSVVEFFIAAVVFFPFFLATGLFFPLASLGFFLNLLSPLSLLLSGFTALVLLAYFTLAELTYQKTFGKALLGLVVVTTDGTPLNIGRAFVRNVSKVYWLLLLLDLVAGFITPLRAGQKFSDHLVNTNVLSARSVGGASTVEGGPKKSVSR